MNSKGLGQLIRFGRRMKDKMPMYTLAAKLGVSPSKIQRLEDGKINILPEPELLRKISAILELDYELLVDSLYDHKKLKREKESQNTYRPIPLLPWKFLTQIHRLDVTTIATGEVFADTTPDAFAVNCALSEWQPFIFKEDTLIITPNLDITENDYVLTVQNSQFDIKHIRHLKGELFAESIFKILNNIPLEPVNTDFQGSIIGVIDQVIRNLRKV